MTTIDTGAARAASYTPASSPGTRMTPFQVTRQAYGPVAASAAAVTGALSDGAGAAVDFSGEALHKLSQAAGDVGDALSSAAQGVQHAGHQAYAAVRDFIGRVEDGAADVAHTVEDAAGSIAQTVGNAVHAVGDGLASAVDTAAGYVGLGVAALK